MKFRLLPLLLLFVLTLASTTASAQSFHRVFSQDGTDVWAVGHDGLVYRSFDGGVTWTQRTVGTAALYDVRATGFDALIVGDGGETWRSSDSGGNWSLTTVAGTPQLRALAMPAAGVAYAVGGGGTIVKSTDGGASWSPQASGTGADLTDVCFSDETHGWVVGASGTVLHTTDGGATWDPVSVDSPENLLGVAQNGSTVWVVGENATARRSVNDGASWDAVDLELDDLADVKRVFLASPTDVYLAGGGGFIRRSTDGGATWTFQQHQLQGDIRGLWFVGGAGWVSNHDSGMIMYTTDGGDTWHMPPGSTVSRSWRGVRLVPGTVRGGTISNHPTNKHAFYCAIGNKVMESLDDGETWNIIQTMPTPVSSLVNAFIVSPKDTSEWLAAVYDASPSNPRKIYRTVNAGVSWTTTLVMNFGQYGIPLEIHPDNPDTVYFAPDGDSGSQPDSLYRSTDFGATWAPISNPVFRSPCDMFVVPGSADTILIADGVTGSGKAQLFKSVDGGVTFTLQYTMPTTQYSESPGVVGSRLRKNEAFATSWAYGDFFRSLDAGTSWNVQTTESGCWGVDVAKDDPNVVIFGRFTGGRTLLSLDGGSTFTNVTIGGNNYSFYARDRATMFAEQSDSIYKMRVHYTNTTTSTQALALSAPVGGESWTGGQTHAITWSATNVAVARIEFQSASGGPWQYVADVPGYLGSYDWTVPYVTTSEARIRVRDLWDSTPRDSSATFSIDVPLAVGTPGATLQLYQNQPNPFDGSTTIRYALPTETDVTLDVYDVLGHRVATLVRGVESPGTHAVRFGRDALDAGGRRLQGLQAGVYFYRLQAGRFTATRKMLLMR